MKMYFAQVLQALARRHIQKFQPTVVAVTGSVGKTSTKNAIALALGIALDVRTAKKNYNNEFGVPLAIFGEYSKGKDLWGWAKLLYRQLTIRSFPSVLVLEYGADKPGDIQASCNIARPDIGVVTAVSPVHVANYPNLGALVEEKSSLVVNVKAGGTVVLNADDLTVAQMRKKAKAPVTTYGIQGHDATISDIYMKALGAETFAVDGVLFRTKATIILDDETVNLNLPNVLGQSIVSACAAALLVAKRMNVPLSDAARALEAADLSGPGRMRPLAGVKGSVILDDTYNAAPASVRAALHVLEQFVSMRPSARRIAVLGAMAELGEYSESEHAEVGRRVGEVANVFVAVGQAMGKAADAALAGGMPQGSIVRCADAVEAGRWLDANVSEGDVVLVKGSQSARMEKAVKDVMAEPARAGELLCRQEQYWLDR